MSGNGSLIYFAQRADSAIKIGVTTNLVQRMQALVSEYGEIVCLGVCSGDRVLENALHERFSGIRHEGIAQGREWFMPAPELLEYIASESTQPKYSRFFSVYRTRQQRTARIFYGEWYPKGGRAR